MASGLRRTGPARGAGRRGSAAMAGLRRRRGRVAPRARRGRRSACRRATGTGTTRPARRRPEHEHEVDEVAVGQRVDDAGRRLGARRSRLHAGARRAPRWPTATAPMAASAQEQRPGPRRGEAPARPPCTRTRPRGRRCRPRSRAARPVGDSRNLSRASSPSQPSRIEWVRNSSAPASCHAGTADRKNGARRAGRWRGSPGSSRWG